MFRTDRVHRCLSILFSLFIWTGISQSRAEILGVTFPYRAPKGDFVTRQDRYHNPVKFNHGFAAYSVLQRLPDGTIGLLAETSRKEGVRYGEISFHRFDIGELEKASR